MTYDCHYNLEKTNSFPCWGLIELGLPIVLLGKALTGYIISVHQTRNELDCSHQCLSNPTCTSFNFEIQRLRSLSTCELNNVLRTSSNNKLQSRDGFAYYEQLTLRERPKQEITARTLTTGQGNIIIQIQIWLSPGMGSCFHKYYA